MITISNPVYTESATCARISASVEISANHKSEIFFETDIQYGSYLTHEVSDAFVLAVLLPALVTQQGIVVETISDHLYYHFKTIVYLLGKAFECNPIKLQAKEIIHTNFSPHAVGTGFSGGIDSLCTYINHTSEECPSTLRITHLALFNVGAYGNNYNQSYLDFSKDLERAQIFAKEVGKPLVYINSNISTLYTHEKIVFYSLRSTLSLAMGILALQKLFRTYYISSTGTIDDFRLSKLDQYYYESALVQRLGNQHLDIFISEHDINRVEKTRILIESPLAQKYLYVCAADIYNSKRGTNFKKDTSPNCCECIKCTRTLLALDFMGALDKFSDRFDLHKWLKVRDQEIARMFIRKERDHFAAENWELYTLSGGYITPEQKTIINQGNLR